jgi:hypothetical protein
VEETWRIVQPLLDAPAPCSATSRGRGGRPAQASCSPGISPGATPGFDSVPEVGDSTPSDLRDEHRHLNSLEIKLDSKLATSSTRVRGHGLSGARRSHRPQSRTHQRLASFSQDVPRRQRIAR